MESKTKTKTTRSVSVFKTRRRATPGRHTAPARLDTSAWRGASRKTRGTPGSRTTRARTAPAGAGGPCTAGTPPTAAATRGSTPAAEKRRRRWQRAPYCARFLSRGRGGEHVAREQAGGGGAYERRGGVLGGRLRI